MSAQQRGASLLLVLFLLSLGSAWWLGRQMADQGHPLKRYQDSRLALQAAKEALISYAAQYHRSYAPGHYGVLPCPDLRPAGEEGNQDSPCGARHVNVAGRLPWQTLGIPPLRDGAGECLWYAVSGSFKGGSSRPALLNGDSPGMFRMHNARGEVVHGQGPDTRPVALIFAPGPALAGQQRAGGERTLCGGNHQASNYLEGHWPLGNEADQVDALAMGAGPLAERNNDLILPVFAEELFAGVWRAGELEQDLYARQPNNLTQRISECLVGWLLWPATGVDEPSTPVLRLPWPAPVSLGDYRQDSSYQDDPVMADHTGRLPLHSTASHQQLYGDCADCEAPEPALMDFCARHWRDQGLEEEHIDALLALWRNWKDHLFYAVGAPFAPSAPLGDTVQCGGATRCPSLSTAAGNTSDWAAMVIFAHRRLPVPGTGKQRSAPPVDADEKAVLGHYLEGVGAQDTRHFSLPMPGQGHGERHNEGYNDVLYCINDHDGADGIPAFASGYCPGQDS